MSQPCSSCQDEAKERNRDMNNLLTKAKDQAIAEQSTKAICLDQIEGLFITDIGTAIREHFYIKQVISHL